MKKIVCILISILMFSTLWAKVNIKKVTITGLLGDMVSYGAPNFGENPEEDDIEAYFVIIPDFNQSCDRYSIEWFSDNPSKEIELTYPMQLVIYDEKIASILKTGVRYQMTGTVMQQHTGHHHTPFLFCVESVKILRTRHRVREIKW